MGVIVEEDQSLDHLLIVIFIAAILALLVFIIYLLWDHFRDGLRRTVSRHKTPKLSNKELLRELENKDRTIKSLERDIQNLTAVLRKLDRSQDHHSPPVARRITFPTRQTATNEIRSDSGDQVATDYRREPAETIQHESESIALCRLYNEGVHDSNKRSEFRDKYRITRISTTNVDDRRRNPNLDAIFQTSNGGEFYVIEIQDHGGPMYVAVPHFDLEINDLSYVHGAAGTVFTCHGYQSGGSYRPARLVAPAHFQLESDNTWGLQRSGELDVA